MTDATRSFLLTSGILPLALIGTMVIMLILGRWVGMRIGAQRSHSEDKTEEIMVGAIFGLLALIVAFSFSGASERYDNRREMIAKEYDAIGTAYGSVDLLADKDQAMLRADFTKLVDERLVLYKHAADTKAYEIRLDQFEVTRNKLWADAVASVKNTPFPEKLVASQILPQISDMNSAIDTQRFAMKMHPPQAVTISLFALILIGAFIAGYNLGLTNHHDWLLIILFVSLMAGFVYLTINLEHPLIGFIGLDDFEIELVRLRQTM